MGVVGGGWRGTRSGKLASRDIDGVESEGKEAGRRENLPVPGGGPGMVGFKQRTGRISDGLLNGCAGLELGLEPFDLGFEEISKGFQRKGAEIFLLALYRTHLVQGARQAQ